MAQKQRLERRNNRPSLLPSFWDHDFDSMKMQQLKSAHKSLDRRLLADKNEARRSHFLDIHKSSDVFPAWLVNREDWLNMDTIISEQKLKRALASSPYMRCHDEAEILASCVMDAWPTAKELGPEQVFKLAKCVHYETFKRGEAVLVHGQDSRSFYIIVEGAAKVIRKKGTVATLIAGSCFGENAVKNGGKTNATVVASSESLGLLVLTKSDYDLIMEDVLVKESIDATYVLKEVDMFQGWGRSRINFVVRLLRREKRSAGEVIVQQGGPPGNVYFISSGNVQVLRHIPIRTQNRWPTGPRQWQTITRNSFLPYKLLDLERGGYFGEKSALDGEVTAAASVVAITDSILFTLDKEDFMALLIRGNKLDDVRRIVQAYPSDEWILRNRTPLRKSEPMKLFEESADRPTTPVVCEPNTGITEIDEGEESSSYTATVTVTTRD